ncbi:endo-1,4-beta-xylanase [Aureimonas sp. AU40]|uniref:endo-1,4-beta-xylanase n=1 Tax=Aureimonas sp. AU40 TaxID=1637747 RepID=UPI000782A3CB|nr:endo-1,4-beta-xylanase [Aureimonas sp. AU40]
MLDRRQFMGGVAALAASGRVADESFAQDGAGDPFAGRPSLRETGERVGIPFGLCEPANRYPGNRTYLDRLASEASLCVPGNDFHWRAVQPSRKVFNSTKLDLFARYLATKDLGMVGHTLLWYHGVPDWVAQLETAADMQAAMEAYVGHMVARFRGRVVRWDVINEQVDPASPREDGLRQTPYLDRMGPGYMARAFAVAREADPKALLCYNEYGFEHAKPEETRKRAALLALLRRLREEKAEIDCVGFQSHLDGSAKLDLNGLAAFTREVVKLGYRVAITELDVKDTGLPADETKRDRIVADQAKAYLDCVMAETKPVTITTWGYTDDKSWYQFYDWSRRRDGRPLRPLAFDADFRRKPLWGVLDAALSAAG